MTLTATPVVFSASSVNMYLGCRMQWWFTYVAALPEERSEAMEVGVETHELVAAALGGPEPRLSGTEVTDEADRLAAVYLADALPRLGEPVLIETPFLLTVNDIPYSGVIDQVFRYAPLGATVLALRDLKTTGSRPSPGRYRFNMVGYALGVGDLLGQMPDEIWLDYIVRVKRPYWWPEQQPPVTDDDIASFVQTVETVAEGVASGAFEPTGLGTRQCGFCPHRAVCGPYQRYGAQVG